MTDLNKLREAFLDAFSSELESIYGDQVGQENSLPFEDGIAPESYQLLKTYGESAKADSCAALLNSFFKFLAEEESGFSLELKACDGMSDPYRSALWTFGWEDPYSMLERVNSIVFWILRIDETILKFELDALIERPIGFTTYHVDELSSISSEISSLPFRCERLETFMVQYGVFVVANSDLSLYQDYGATDIKETFAKSLIGKFVELRSREEKEKNTLSSSLSPFKKLAVYAMVFSARLLGFVAFISLPLTGYLLLMPFEQDSLESLAVFGLAWLSLLFALQFYLVETEQRKEVTRILQVADIERLAQARSEAVSLFRICLSSKSTPLEMVFYKFNKLQLIRVPDGLLSILFRAKCSGDTEFNRVKSSLKSFDHEFKELIDDGL